MKLKKIKIILFIIFFILGVTISFSIGYASGFKAAVNWGIDKAIWFLDLKGIELDVNLPMIKEGIEQYQNRIGGCFTDAYLNRS